MTSYSVRPLYKVTHLKLLFKLQVHGVQGKTLGWIESLLVARSKTFVLDGESSDELPVLSRVPHGSVLGPILFLLYINDLPENVLSQARLFADDIAAYLTAQGPKDSERLQSDLNALQKWEEKWDMEFNPSKCQVLHITRSHNPIRYNYTMHGQTLESVGIAWYLEVDISSDLGFSHHNKRIT